MAEMPLEDWLFWKRYDRDQLWGEERSDLRQEALVAYMLAVNGATVDLPDLQGPNYYPTKEELDQRIDESIARVERKKQELLSGKQHS